MFYLPLFHPAALQLLISLIKNVDGTLITLPHGLVAVTSFVLPEYALPVWIVQWYIVWFGFGLCDSCVGCFDVVTSYFFCRCLQFLRIISLNGRTIENAWRIARIPKSRMKKEKEVKPNEEV